MQYLSSLRQYFGAVLKYWVGIVVSVVSGLAWFIVWLLNVQGMPVSQHLPVWLFPMFLVGGVVFAQFLAFHEVRVERDSLKGQLSEAVGVRVIPPPRTGVIGGGSSRINIAGARISGMERGIEAKDDASIDAPDADIKGC